VNEHSIPILLLLDFLLCTYLSHSKFNYKFWFSSYIYIVLIFEVMKSDDDTIENDKIM
jgi:nucleoside-specific outer membrane channel protein Tsx